MKDTLPRTLSALLRLAVQDCIRAEAQGVVLNMSGWYQREGHTCEVCMAGAVLLYDVELDPGEELPDELVSYIALDRFVDDDEVLRKMSAINDIRVIEVYEALSRLRYRHITPEQEATCDALIQRWRTHFCEDDDCVHESPGALCTAEQCSCDNLCTGISLTHGRLSWEQYLEIAAALEGVGL